MMLLINTYLVELMAVSSIALLMAVIPGADFVMVTRNSIRGGRLAGITTSLGISLSICIHAAYTIAGLALVIANSPWLFTFIKFLGAAYLIYIAFRLITANEQLNNNADHSESKLYKAFALGFMSNMLNPKAPIFFISIFTQVISAGTPLAMQLGYASIIVLAHLIWFSGVALLLSCPAWLTFFQRHKQLVDKVAGAVLMLFAVKLTLF